MSVKLESSIYIVKKTTILTFHLVCLFLCLFVSLSLPLVHYGQLLGYADKRTVNIMKGYIERRNVHFELGTIP